MSFTLEPLPYDSAALEPYISAKTFSFHHGKHHQTYVNNLNNLTKDTQYAGLSLNDIIKKAYAENNRPVFNNSAQHFNHAFFWKCMKPGGGGECPDNELGKAIVAEFGSFKEFRDQFKTTAATHFGSGWAFLVLNNADKKLKVVGCHDAETPVAHDQTPILTADVWEHAYYLDYQNRRPDYIEDFLNHLVNWDFANENYIAAKNA